MTLSKVVRKGNYQGVAQWGINTSSEITPSRKTAQKWAELENAHKNVNVTVKVGDVVAVRGEHGRVVNAFVFRTFTNGEFRAIPETHMMYRNAVDWCRAGNTAELLKHKIQIEYMSRVYSQSELRER